MGPKLVQDAKGVCPDPAADHTNVVRVREPFCIPEPTSEPSEEYVTDPGEKEWAQGTTLAYSALHLKGLPFLAPEGDGRDVVLI